MDVVGSRAGSGEFSLISRSRDVNMNRLFLIDGVISAPIALSGFFILPDVPEISSPWYLSKKVSSTSQDQNLVLMLDCI